MDNLLAECVFNATGLSHGWPNQTGDALCMEGDDLPSHIHRTCRGKIISIEGKLQNLCELSAGQYQIYIQSRYIDMCLLESINLNLLIGFYGN